VRVGVDGEGHCRGCGRANAVCGHASNSRRIPASRHAFERDPEYGRWSGGTVGGIVTKDFLHALGLLCLCLLLVRPAQAFVDPPWITPDHPQVGQTIYVNIRSGVCDVITIAPIPPEITQAGSAVRILFWSGHYTDPIQCIYPIDTGAIAIGAFAPGSYTLQVERWYQVYGMGTQTEILGILPFTVEGSGVPPAPAPALDLVGLSLLAVLLAWVARKRLSGALCALLLSAAFAPTEGAGAAAVPVPEPASHAIHLLMRIAPGAPSAQALVEYAQRPEVPPPLAAF
jgi:hypothetical protein